MNDAMSPPALAAVVAVRLRDFLRAPVAEQMRLKAQIEVLIEQAAAPLACGARIVLDASHGLVVVILAGPADALAFAQRVRAAAGELAVCIGLDYGPVRAVDHERRGSGLVGDGIVASMAVAAATSAGRIAASRGFREVLDWAAPGRAVELVAAGSFTDANSQAHEIYAWDPRVGGRRQRRFIAASLLGAAAILGIGVAANGFLAEEAHRPANLEFDIAPAGEVIVDGLRKGTSPPLRHLEVEPGVRSIEVRATGYPALTLKVNLAPQQTMTIQHRFTKPATPRSREERMIDKLRRELGL